jgi:threonine dehydratase
VRRVGEETFRLAKQYLDEILLVTTDQICAAIQDIFEDTRSIAEPAGALAVAGIKKFVAREACTGRTLVAINGGANMNFDRLRYVAERADVGAQREVLLAVEILEAPGSFLRLCELLGNRSVTEFNYRYSDAKTAQLFVGLSIAPGLAMRTALIQTLRDAGFAVRDMTDDETAKLHVRYMVGGHPGNLEHERLYRFELPERPGALLKFLRAIGTQWNVSLFHYRNDGSEHGRVLAGIQVPADTATDFLLHINELQYPYAEETDNPAYRLFLSR